MDQKIVALPTAKREPDAECIDLLRNILEAAERGEITGVAIVTIDADSRYSGVGTAWAGEGIHGGVHVALGGISYLHSRFIKEKFETINC